MSDTKLKINAQSIRTELKSYENDPLKCLIEYIWNSFDADATEIHLNFELPEEGATAKTRNKQIGGHKA
jgi:hypothetical protein